MAGAGVGDTGKLKALHGDTTSRVIPRPLHPFLSSATSRWLARGAITGTRVELREAPSTDTCTNNVGLVSSAAVPTLHAEG